ncbi:MAG: hypothetical protein DRN04_02120 [Thermoprotei archaeon]|nr:MAG: hypothetical protein DRN04_02120 [Thermoprotei archaeon]
MSEKMKIFRLKVSKLGEIYTTKELRKLAGISAPGEVIAIVTDKEVIARKLVTLEELLERKPVLKISFEEAEKYLRKFRKSLAYEASA